MQPVLQLRVPVVPQLVVQLVLVPGEHSTVSSMRPSQSSSTPLQPSGGGTHAPSVHVASQVRLPVEPQLVMQLVELPRAQPKPSSTLPSQSSSAPLQVSAGGTHAPTEQSSPHARVPVEPQLVVQLELVPRTHANTSSGAPLQSSSTPLHVSGGGEQTPHEQLVPQTRVPVVPHVVVQSPMLPRQHVNASSHCALQSSSIPLQTSGAPGNASALLSLQSLAGTPPTSGQLASPKPSPSRSAVDSTHAPRMLSLQRELVHAVAVHSTGVPGAHAIATQRSVPLHATPSLHSASAVHVRGGQPVRRSQVKPSWQNESFGVLRHVPTSQTSVVHATSSSHSAFVRQPTPPSRPPSGMPPSSTMPTQRPPTQSTPSGHIRPTHSASITISTVVCTPRTKLARRTRRATNAPSRTAVTVIVTPWLSTAPGRSETVCGQPDSSV
jgi:hypothetical protein